MNKCKSKMANLEMISNLCRDKKNNCGKVITVLETRNKKKAISVARPRLTNVIASLIFMYSKANKFKNKCFTVN